MKIKEGQKMMITINLNINGLQHLLQVQKNWTLLYVLRDVLNLTGTKYGCGTNDCGACKVLVDGKAVNSCTLLSGNVQDKEIITIEGVGQGNSLHPIQEAFIEVGALQCGFCTPGMIISSLGLLKQNPNPSKDEIAQALDNNLCRCTGYIKIMEAIQLAAKRMRGEQHGL
jgi:carbon-monoxide dehydrogenase small subunit